MADLNCKFGAAGADVRNDCASMSQRVAGLGFMMDYNNASVIYNTHDAYCAFYIGASSKVASYS